MRTAKNFLYVMLTVVVLLTIQAIIDSPRIGGQTTDSSRSEKTTKAIAPISAYDGAGNNSAQSSTATATTQAPPVSGSSKLQLATALGWFDIPKTHLRSVCPPPANFTQKGVVQSYVFSGYCNQVTGAWNSGVMDTLRNRLIIWGGGHAD